LIGYGAWGQYHARAIRETEGCRLTAIACATEVSRKAAAAQTCAFVSANFQDVIARDDVDVVDIVVPNYLHETVACAALQAGKPVLLEKPMSISIVSCDRIIEAARTARKLLLIGHEMRFSGLYAEMRRLIDSGRIGQPRYVLIDLWRRPYRPGSGAWRLDPERVGNWTLEEPVHFFDAAAWYLSGSGEPVSVYAYGNGITAPFDPDRSDNFTATFSYADRAYATISQSLSAVEHHLSIKIFGTKSVIRAEWHAELDRSERPAYSLEISENGTMRRVEVPSTPGELFELRAEIEAMARAVSAGEALPIAPEEARRAVRLCVEARRSLESGAVVRL
jgi:myo-inositol 2-dehydrogenase/D-chiro-inositol 1-dehydrogenase